MSSAARAFDQRSSAAVAQVVAELDNGNYAPEEASPTSPSVAAGGLDFRAAQIAKDAEFAAQLQQEEYREEEARTERRRQRRAAAAAEQNTSWTDWLMGMGTATPTNAPSSSPSLGGTMSSPARPASSSTGIGGRGARVAQPSTSMFSCVAQSITSVMGPQHGEVSGVDSTSLL
mmetsp:Transcript_13902/g.32380  ORF Transcript_13902/g.32380 Transcript_13902/m.32380 type:complete len:174 (+) Transcript_13902:125-646(+)|eukprot:CAMPEP_0197173450 /NCGR_PEP_ID=MMETSP1423-20130617/380_1 /TAXON_ID=476441 /ORGANISM="Pseudo-nitzschia heimii, Strain UNC1101" /LENGTH=173 /DNA_ID=CAMNT_0042622271 /DNA_START=116 /DNA_END=637 /DNA_ORIENTATION=+